MSNEIKIISTFVSSICKSNGYNHFQSANLVNIYETRKYLRSRRCMKNHEIKFLFVMNYSVDGWDGNINFPFQKFHLVHEIADYNIVMLSKQNIELL